MYLIEQSWMFGQKKEATDKQCCPVLAPFCTLEKYLISHSCTASSVRGQGTESEVEKIHWRENPRDEASGKVGSTERAAIRERFSCKMMT